VLSPPRDRDLKELIRSPKPAFVATGFWRRRVEDPIVSFSAIFDGRDVWVIEQPASTEVRVGPRTIFVDGDHMEVSDRSRGINKVKVALDGRQWTYLAESSFQVIGESIVAGRLCQQVLARGLRHEDTVPVEICLDLETGLALPTSRDGQALVEVHSFRIGRTGDPRQYVGKGTVYIAWDDGRHWGYWDLQPDGPPRHLEQMPEFASAAEAIEWGRSRTDRVVIRPELDPSHHY
jgi:hypothetical protein